MDLDLGRMTLKRAARHALLDGTTPPPPPAVPIIILAGQSNMVGRANFDGGLSYPATAFQFRQDGSVAAATPPLDHVDEAPGAMGLSVAFAQAFAAENSGQDFHFVPVADGGTGFADGAWAQGGSHFNAMVSQAAAAKAAVPGGQVVGVLWLQGERDAQGSYTDTQSGYAGDLDAMISALRTVVPDAAVAPFIAGQIGRFLGGTYSEATALNAAIADLPNRVANTSWVSSGGQTDLGDGVHFDAASLRRLGYLFYERWKGTDQIVPNGDFYVDDVWNAGASWSVAGGKASINSTTEDGGDANTIEQRDVMWYGDADQDFQVELQVSNISTTGSAELRLSVLGVSGWQIEGITAPGTYTTQVTLGGLGGVLLRKLGGGVLTADVDYVRITPV